MESQYFYKKMKSPVGELTLIASDRGLAAVLWENDEPSRVKVKAHAEDKKHPVLLEAEKQLTQYFGQERKEFKLPLDMIGTDFQKKVWRALQKIPFGETHSYGQLAKNIGNAKASRAVGAANGKNPLSIVVPCHRVIGASGKLTGFAGGLEAKARLIAIESNQT